MKFPILIHLLHNKAKHVVNSFEEIPREAYFKIIRTDFVVDNFTIECDYRVIDPEPQEELTEDGSTQKDIEPSGTDSA